ncbi:rhodanese-like domain-containing protein [Wenyingzhuangia sp. IMCC45574]
MKTQIEFYQNKLAYEMDSADLFEAFENQENVVALDTRKLAAYKTEHIPTAINVPHREMTAESTAHLDKNKTYVCYCDGIGCNGSTKGALKMTKLGFKVQELIGGLDWWKRDGYATEGTSAVQGTGITCNC